MKFQRFVFTLFILFYAGTSVFAQEDDTLQLPLIIPDPGIQLNVQEFNIDPALLMPVENCAHGHICCAVGCGCCTELLREQIYDTVYAVKHNGIQRITVAERYRYAMIHDINPVHYRFRKTNGEWSERYYPVHIYEGLDYERYDKKFGQYPKLAESRYLSTNQALVLNENGEYLLIDLNGNTIPFTFHASTKISDEVYLSSVIIEQQQIFCFTNSKGELLSKRQYLTVNPFNADGVAVVGDLRNNVGLVDASGNEILPCKYRYINRIGPDRYFVEEHDQYSPFNAIINSKGEAITPDCYSYIGNYSEGLVAVKDKVNQLCYLDMDGNEVLKPAVEWGGEFHDGLAAVQTIKEGTKNEAIWGFMDKTGAIVIEPQYYRVYAFHDGAAPVCTGHSNSESWKVINKKGNVISPQNYSNIEPFKNGIAQVSIAGKGCGFIDSNGKELMPCGYASFNSHVNDSWEVDGMIVRYDYRSDSTLEIVNRYGKQLKSLKQYKYVDFIQKDSEKKTVYPFMRVYKYDNKSNLLDANGKELLDKDYETVQVFSEHLAVGAEGPNNTQQSLINIETGKVIKVLGNDNVYDIKYGVITVHKYQTHYEYDFYDLKGNLLKGY